METCTECGQWYNAGEEHICNPETIRVRKVMDEYDNMLKELREEYSTADGTVTPDELDAIAKDLHHRRINWLKTKGITDEELNEFQALSKAFGRPQFKLGKTTISFARAELRDLLYYRLLNDEQLVDSWKSTCFCTTHGGVSMNDLQQLELMECEMSKRQSIDNRIDELKEWYSDMEQEDPFNECPPTCDDCLYTDDEKEQKTVCPGCPNYVCEHDMEPTDTEGHSMECTKCGMPWTLQDGPAILQPNREPYEAECRYCGETTTLMINMQDLVDWVGKEKLLQDAFPYLSPAERELIKSEQCGKCWDNMFGRNPATINWQCSEDQDEPCEHKKDGICPDKCEKFHAVEDIEDYVEKPDDINV